MNRRITGAILASAVTLGGLTAVAVPTLASAADSSTSSSTSSFNPIEMIKSALAGLVTDGTITQAQADTVASTLADKLPEGRGPGGPGGPGERGGHGFGGHLSAAATALGMSEDDVRTALEGGSSLASLAESKGMTKDALIDAIVAAMQTEWEQRAADRPSDAPADAPDAPSAEQLRDMVTKMVEQEGLQTPPVDGGRDTDKQGDRPARAADARKSSAGTSA